MDNIISFIKPYLNNTSGLSMILTMLLVQISHSTKILRRSVFYSFNEGRRRGSLSEEEETELIEKGYVLKKLFNASILFRFSFVAFLLWCFSWKEALFFYVVTELGAWLSMFLYKQVTGQSWSALAGETAIFSIPLLIVSISVAQYFH